MAKSKHENLTDKQAMFCKEYLIDLNATQAAIRAGYSEATAQVIGSENLSKPIIQAEIQDLIKKRSERTEITSDMVLKELAKIGFSNIAEFTDNSNGIVNINSLEQIKTACISSIECVTRLVGDDAEITVTKLKLHDKISALEKIGRHLGMFEKDNEQKKPMVAPQIIMPNGNKPK
jgi:phage terminase small subunit